VRALLNLLHVNRIDSFEFLGGLFCALRVITFRCLCFFCGSLRVEPLDVEAGRVRAWVAEGGAALLLRGLDIEHESLLGGLDGPAMQFLFFTLLMLLLAALLGGARSRRHRVNAIVFVFVLF